MPKKTTADLLNSLFFELNNIIAPADLSDNAPAPKAFVTTMFPGVTVLPADFDPDTAAGQKNLFTWMNNLPAVNKCYLNSGKKCSDMYKKILSAQFPPDDPAKAKAMEQEFKTARAFVLENIEVYDRCKDAFDEAQNKLFRIRNRTDLPGPEHQEQIRQATVAVNNAKRHWDSLGLKSQVEAALSTCARYLAYTPNKVFADAQSLFEQSEVAGFGYPVICTPRSWATDPDSLSWTDVVVGQTSSVSKAHHDVQKLDSSLSVNFRHGPWHAAASGEFHDQLEKLNKSASVENLSIAFEVARVEVQREWFSSALLTYSQAIIPGKAAGGVCAGSLAKADQCDFPFLPTAFVVARNIRVYNQFSGQELDFLNHAQSWGAKVSVGYGPFSLGAGASHSKDLTDEEKRQFGSCVKLTAGKGIQLIGFLNTVLTPAFPGRSDTTSTVSILRALEGYTPDGQ